jgi:peroxiredoxin
MPETILILNPGQMMPDFSLPSSLGRPFRVSDFRNRSNLVLVICNLDNIEEISLLLPSLNAAASEISQENSSLALILPKTLDEVETIVDEYGVIFPVLADPDKKVIQGKVHVNDPGLEMYILDRYGEIAAVERVETAGFFPKPVEILDWVRYLEIQCPE